MREKDISTNHKGFNDPAWQVNLEASNYMDADLSNQTFKGMYMPGSNFAGAKFFQTEMEKVRMFGSNFYKSELRDVKLTGNLEGCNFYSADLTGADLERAALNGSNFTGAVLKNASLQGARLREANLSRADLENANLEDADLWGANLNRAYLSGANLKAANLECAFLENTILENIVWDELTVWPEGFAPDSGTNEKEENLFMGMESPDFYYVAESICSLASLSIFRQGQEAYTVDAYLDMIDDLIDFNARSCPICDWGQACSQCSLSIWVNELRIRFDLDVYEVERMVQGAGRRTKNSQELTLTIRDWAELVIECKESSPN